MVEFNEKFRPRTEGKDKKRDTLYEGRELTLNTFRSGISPIKSRQGKGRPSDLAT